MDYQEAIEYMRKEAHRQTVNSEGQDAYIIAISAMLELQEYKKLGTLEEVRETVERQKAKELVREQGEQLENKDMLDYLAEKYDIKAGVDTDEKF